MTIHGINVNLQHKLEKLQRYKHNFNVLNLENNYVKDIDWQTTKEWISLSKPEDIFLSDNIVNDALFEAKIYETEKWKQNTVFQSTQYVGQQTISSRWIITEKINSRKKVVKVPLA